MTNVICIVTAKDCGHCRQMRRPTLTYESPGGELSTIPGGYAWMQGFFTRLLFGLGGEVTNPGETAQGLSRSGVRPSFRVYEVNLPHIGSDPQQATEFTDFVWDGNKVEPRVMTNPTDIARHVPSGLKAYIKMYPSFCFFNGDSWDANLANSGPLIGMVLGLKTIEMRDPSGKVYYGIDRDVPIDGSDLKTNHPVRTAMKLKSGRIPTPSPSVDLRGTAPRFSRPRFQSPELTPQSPVRKPLTALQPFSSVPPFPDEQIVMKGDRPDRGDLGYRIVGN